MSSSPSLAHICSYLLPAIIRIYTKFRLSQNQSIISGKIPFQELNVPAQLCKSQKNDSGFDIDISMEVIDTDDENVDNLIEENVIEENVTENVVEENVTENVVEENVTENVAEENVTENVIEENVTENMVEENVTENVIEENVTENVVEENVTENMVEENVTENVIKKNVTENVVEENVTENVAEENVTENVIEENVTENMVEENVTENVIEENVTENVVEENVTENVVEENVTENMAEENVTEKLIEENVTENMVEENVTENVIEENVTENVVEENVTENVVEENVTENVVEENVTENVAEENVTKNMVEENVTENVVEENVTENDKKVSTKPSRPCLFCKKTQSRLKRHILTKHKNDPQVSPLLKMSLKEQDRQIAIFRREAIKNVNLELIRAGKNEFIRERKSNDQTNDADIPIMCTGCKGFFAKKYKARHQIICPSADSNLMVPMVVLTQPHDYDKYTSEFKDLLNTLYSDEIGNYVKQDEIVLMFGDRSFNSLRRKKDKIV